MGLKTTVVGSFPKVWEGPGGAKLIGAISKRQKDVISDAELQSVFDEVTKRVIEEQEGIGLDIITDGQIRWDDLVTPFARGLKGFKINGLNRFFNNNVYYRRPVVTGNISRNGDLIADEAEFAKRCVKRSKLKATLAGPYTFARLSENKFYRNQNQLILDIAKALNEEAKRLQDIGIEYIQIDEPSLAYENPKDIRRILDAIDIVFSGCGSAKKALYLYFGCIGKTLLQGLLKCNIDILGLDFVSCADSSPLILLKDINFTKELALGCVDARNTKLEEPDILKRLFDKVSRIVPSDKIYINPNCGLEFLPYEKAVAKLENMVKVAKEWEGR